MRGRGLKLTCRHHQDSTQNVAPMRGHGSERKSKVYNAGTADGLAYITSFSVFDFLMTCLDVFSLLEIMQKKNRK